MLEVKSITKRFDGRTVLKDIDLELSEGHIFGLLGTNGAGKSTLLRIMAGLYEADSGETRLDGVTVSGHPEMHRDICYLSDDPAFLPGATVRSMAKWQKAYFEGQDDELLRSLCERFSLPMDDTIASMSKGTQKRAQIVLGLARRPKALLCDETFDGLDPVMRRIFRSVLGEMTLDNGLITVLAGHDLQELEDICDSVAFLHEGTLLTSGDLDEVRERIFRVQFVLPEEPDGVWVESLSPLRVQRQGRLFVLTLRSGDTAMDRIMAKQPEYIERLPLSLEEVFILEMEEQGYAK